MIGQRVKIKAGRWAGHAGVVRGRDSGEYLQFAVEIDGLVMGQGHDCWGWVPSGRGWFMGREEFVPVATDPFRQSLQDYIDRELKPG